MKGGRGGMEGRGGSVEGRCGKGYESEGRGGEGDGEEGRGRRVLPGVTKMVWFLPSHQNPFPPSSPPSPPLFGFPHPSPPPPSPSLSTSPRKLHSPQCLPVPHPLTHCLPPSLPLPQACRSVPTLAGWASHVQTAPDGWASPATSWPPTHSRGTATCCNHAAGSPGLERISRRPLQRQLRVPGRNECAAVTAEPRRPVQLIGSCTCLGVNIEAAAATWVEGAGVK